MDETLLRTSIANRLDAPAKSRAALSKLAGLSPDALAKTRLIASELVANAVRHGKGPEVLIQVCLEGDTLRCSVSDHGRGFAIPDKGPDSPNAYGWGLILVRRMADRWGVVAGRSSVWFELDGAAGAPGLKGR